MGFLVPGIVSGPLAHFLLDVWWQDRSRSCLKAKLKRHGYSVPGAEVTCPMVGGDKAVADHVCY